MKLEFISDMVSVSIVSHILLQLGVMFYKRKKINLSCG